MSLRRVDDGAGVEQLAGAAPADQGGQDGGFHHRGQPQLHFRHAVAAFLAADAQVAAGGHLHARAQAESVHPGDAGNGQGAEEVTGLMHLVDEGQGFFRIEIGHLIDVRPADEGPLPGAGEDHQLQFVISLQFQPFPQQGLQHGSGQQVESGFANGQRGHPALVAQGAFDQGGESG